jgi:hypothetical protein
VSVFIHFQSELPSTGLMCGGFGYCPLLCFMTRKGRRNRSSVEECVFDKLAVAKRRSHIFSLPPDVFVIT